MRILLFNQYFTPDASASARLLSDLAADLAANHEVTAIVGRASYEATMGSMRPLPPRLRVVRVLSAAFPRIRIWPRVVNYVSYLAAASIAGLLQQRPHLVIVGSDPPLLGLVGLFVARVFRCPLVHLLWDIQPQATVAAGHSVPFASLVERANRTGLTAADGMAVPTAAMASTARELGVPPERVTVISHWENTDAIRPGSKDNAFSRTHGLVHRFVIMYAGNFGLTQQLDRYLELATRLGQSAEDSCLVFVGGGAAQDVLRARARQRHGERVRILPYCPHEHVPDVFASADVFLVPLAPGLTRFMLPSKVYTIMAAGRPFVAAIDPSCDLAQAIRDLDCGFVTPPGDLDGIAERLLWLRANPEARLAMGNRGRTAAETRFSRTIAAIRYREWLQRFDCTIDPNTSAREQRAT